MIIEIATLSEIIGYLIKTFIGIAIPYLWSQINQYRKEQRAMNIRREEESLQLKRALQCMARDRLIQAHDFYIRKGWIPVHAMSALWALYESYESLGKNGVIDGLMEQLKALPNHNPATLNQEPAITDFEQQESLYNS